jgi:hypothetical protein
MARLLAASLLCATASLVAAGPSAPARVMVLAYDARGNIVPDLAPGDFRVKENDRPVPVDRLEGPAAVSQRPAQWLIVFEPVREPDHRLIAFQAAAEFLATFAEGDTALIVVRDKKNLLCLTPGFTASKDRWAEALERAPTLLVEKILDPAKPGEEIAGLDPAFKDAGAGSGKAFAAVLADLRKGAPRFATGTRGLKGMSTIQRLGLTDSSSVASLTTCVVKESQALAVLFQKVAALPGDKQAIVFSRYEADDLASSAAQMAAGKDLVPQANNRGGDGSSGAGVFNRSKGDNGGPGEYMALAVRDTTLARLALQNLVTRSGITLHSAAGTGSSYLGSFGSVASATGGRAFPLDPSLPSRLPGVLASFNARYGLTWTGAATPEPIRLDITTGREGVTLVRPTQR